MSRDMSDAFVGAAGLYRATKRPAQAGPLYLAAALSYEKLTAATCHTEYKYGLADSAAGLACAYSELQKPTAAKEAALNATRAYRDLRSLEPSFTPDAYARALVDQLPILEKSGADPATTCPIAAEAVANATDPLTKESARAFTAGCAQTPPEGKSTSEQH
jgi:hypothetical protein